MRKDSGSDAVVFGAGDDDKSVIRGASGCSKAEDDSRDLGGSQEGVVEEAVDESGSRRGLNDVSKKDDQVVMNDSIVIEVKPQQGLGESLDWEMLCRICYLNSEGGSDVNVSKVADKDSNAANHTAELILLGCRCKGQLGMAHRCCAEEWFKLRRSRLCEICGQTAENVSGRGDNGFMEEWNDGQGHAGTSTSSTDGGGGWNQQLFCNLLIACVVMAFILPWFFFRLDLF